MNAIHMAEETQVKQEKMENQHPWRSKKLEIGLFPVADNDD
jgi:hypothetical protein